MYVYATKEQLEYEPVKKFNKFMENLCSDVEVLKDKKVTYKLVGGKTDMLIKLSGSAVIYEYLLIIEDIFDTEDNMVLFNEILDLAKLSVSDPKSSIAMVRPYYSYIHVIAEGSMKTESASTELNILIVTKDSKGEYVELRKASSISNENMVWTNVIGSANYLDKVNKIKKDELLLKEFRNAYLRIKNLRLKNKQYECDSFSSYIEAINNVLN